jgi:hypothetical protein
MLAPLNSMAPEVSPSAKTKHAKQNVTPDKLPTQTGWHPQMSKLCETKITSNILTEGHTQMAPNSWKT